MISRVWQRLYRQLKTPDYLWATWLFGILAGLLVPVLLVLGGWLMVTLMIGQSGLETKAAGEGVVIAIGPFVSPWSVAGASTLSVAFGIIAATVVVAAIELAALLACYRFATISAIDLAVDIQRRLFAKSDALSIDQGLSGQQEAMRDMLFAHVPQLREAASLWTRVFPRHIIQSVLLVGLAFSIHIWITALAMVCAVSVWWLHSTLEAGRRKRRPVQFERARASSEQLAYLCETSPLLETMQKRDETQHSFEAQLQTYRLNQIQLADGGIWKSPYMMLPTALLSIFLMLVVSVRFLDPTSRMHLAELLTLIAAVGLALAGVQRFLFALRRYRTAERAALSVADYLEQPTAVHTDRIWIPLTGPRYEIVLDHVTFRNSTAQKLLEDISASIKPGTLTAVIASEGVQSSALAEMILGFGKPASGRILVNGIDSTDVEPAQIRNLSLWVSSKGPLVNGTLEENLWAGAPHDATVDMMACAKKMNVSDQILNLPDGLATIVTPSEDRLQSDDIFRIGLTRGLIKNPSLIVAHEPANRVEPFVEEKTSEAIRALVAPNRMLVVLAHRLATLRDADQIIVLHEHRIAGVGNHVQLLENCEIYRHINYMMFSPF